MSALSTERSDRLRTKLASDSTAVITIDLQNDFCAPEGVMGLEGADLTAIDAALAAIRDLLDAARATRVAVIHVRNVYSTDDRRYLSESFLDVAARRLSGRALVSVPLCQPGTWGADHAPGFEPESGEPVVIKHRYSGFYQTDLELLLRTRGIKTVVPCGVATNVCVESTARDAFMRDLHVILPADGAATYFGTAHDATLSTISMHFGEVSSVGEIVGVWHDHGHDEGQSR